MVRALKTLRPLIFFFVFGVLFAGAAWMAFRADAPVRAELAKSQGKEWKQSDEGKFYAAVRVYGDWPWLMLASGAGLLVAWRLGNRPWQRILVAAMLASTLSGAVVNLSRLTTGRTRPAASKKIEQGFYGPWKDGRLTVGNWSYNSFPSGHTATAFGLAWVIVLVRPWLGVGALVLAGLVGLASVRMGAHHPSDVVVSVFVSFAVAWFTWRGVRDRGEEAVLWLREQWRRMRAGRPGVSQKR